MQHEAAEANAERLNKVADMIQSHPEHFAMDYFFGVRGDQWIRVMGPEDTAEAMTLDLFDCGTTGCIAGWACFLWAAEVDPEETIDVNAAAILGLRYSDADRLFSNWDLDTADKAADHLRRMALAAEVA